MSIFTRNGDSGMTSLAGGKRVPKDDLRVEAYGTLDELNSFVGRLKSLTNEGQLEDIQRMLFAIGGYLAYEEATSFSVPSDDVSCIERLREEIESELVPLQRFILPGGSEAASVCHICRTVCRRAERRMITFSNTVGREIDEKAFRYINRLSDYFFVLARKINKDAGIEDVFL